MAEKRQATGLVISHKQGVPVYETNPSIPTPEDIKRKKPIRLGDDQKGFVINGAGEVIGTGSAAFYEFEEVDDIRFVKMYLAGVKQATGLTKAGLAVFELVYHLVQENPNDDRVNLSFLMAAKKIEGLSERTYYRGLRELLEREFLFRSPYDGTFFINVRFMFNGDRLAFVKGYKRKPSKPTLPSPQQDLFAMDKQGE